MPDAEHSPAVEAPSGASTCHDRVLSAGRLLLGLVVFATLASPGLAEAAAPPRDFIGVQGWSPLSDRQLDRLDRSNIRVYRIVLRWYRVEPEGRAATAPGAARTLMTGVPTTPASARPPPAVCGYCPSSWVRQRGLPRNRSNSRRAHPRSRPCETLREPRQGGTGRGARSGRGLHGQAQQLLLLRSARVTGRFGTRRTS